MWVFIIFTLSCMYENRFRSVNKYFAIVAAAYLTNTDTSPHSICGFIIKRL